MGLSMDDDNLGNETYWKGGTLDGEASGGSTDRANHRVAKMYTTEIIYIKSTK